MHGMESSNFEEAAHASQKQSNNSYQGMPQGWMMQASSAVVRRVSSIYESMGGRNLKHAPSGIRKAWRCLSTRIVHPRPSRKDKCTTGMMTYVSAKKKAGVEKTRKKLCADFSSLGTGEQLRWQAVEAENVRKRPAAAMTPPVPATMSPTSATPLGLGNVVWPLKEYLVEEICDLFASRDKASLQMQRAGVAPAVINNVVGGPTFRVDDAMWETSKTLLATEVDADFIAKFTTHKLGLATEHRTLGAYKEGLDKCCNEKHPGYCPKRDVALSKRYLGILAVM